MYRSGMVLFLSLSVMAIITKHCVQACEIIIGIKRKSSFMESSLITAEERKKLNIIKISQGAINMKTNLLKLSLKKFIENLKPSSIIETS